MRSSCRSRAPSFLSSTLGLLRSYLTSLDLDFRDLQEALDQVEGNAPKRLRDGLERLEHRVGELEKHLGLGRAPGGEEVGQAVR